METVAMFGVMFDDFYFLFFWRLSLFKHLQFINPVELDSLIPD